MPHPRPLVSARCIRKTYPGGVVANDCVSLDIYPGEVLALLGENGAGKTTFVSILAGLVQPDSGEILVDGRPVVFHGPGDAVRAGIALVPQHPMLIEGFTVAENLLLAARSAGLRMSLVEARERLRRLSESLGLRVDPDARVWRLSMGERQRAELLRALSLGARVLLLDEVTTHFSPKEARGLTALMRRLAGEGKSVVFITHKLWEALEAADRIAVMRSGRLVGIVERGEAEPSRLLEMMFGRSAAVERAYPPRSPGEAVLAVNDLWVRGGHGEFAVQGVSLEVRRGEVLGIAGVAGNGQRELFEALVGLRRPEKGRILLGGVDVTHVDPAGRARMGVAVIPEERLGWALVPGHSLVFNTALGMYAAPGGPFRGPFVDWRRARELALSIVEKMRVKAPGVEAPPESLSGGNMQRFIVGRELAKNPRVLLAMNPTSGLDVDATRFVRDMIDEAARGGAAVLLVSEDLDELLELSDRVAVMSRGRLVLVEERPFNVDRIAEAMVS